MSTLGKTQTRGPASEVLEREKPLLQGISRHYMLETLQPEKTYLRLKIET